MPLYGKILIGLGLGVVLGVVAVQVGWTGVVGDWVKPWGEIFMRLLKCVAVPLVFVSLVRGVGNLGSVTSLSRLGFRTLGIYVLTTLFAIGLGLGLVSWFGPGRVVSEQSAGAMMARYTTTEGLAQTTGQAVREQVATLAEQGPLQPLVDLFPENMIGALGNNGGMLQVIVIALLVGVALLLTGREKTEAFRGFMDALDAILLKVIDLIMHVAPVGVFALIAGTVADTAGSMDLLGALGLYVVTVVAGLLLLGFVFYPLWVHLFSAVSGRKFLKTMPPVQLLAFTTSSSAATLPLNMETVERKLGVSKKVTSFVLPVGMTINMDGTSLYQAVAAVFIAQVLGIELGWAGMLTILATTTVSSIGTPGVPGGSMVILVMVLSSVGIPAEGLALILGLDRPLDMLRTVVNVTGDAVVASIVDKQTAH